MPDTRFKMNGERCIDKELYTATLTFEQNKREGNVC